jgi:polar amino acid transport system substrate-binding protein
MITRSTFVKGTAALATTLGLCLVGCGGSQPAASETTDDTEATATDTAAAADGDLGLVTAGTLTCVSELGFAPFEYLEAGSTEPVGFDIDLANEIAKRLNLTCEFLPTQDFDTLVPTIKEGNKADIAIAGITITDQRAKEIDFSDPYFESNLAVCARIGDGRTTDDFNAADTKVACQTGTTGDAWVEENMPEATKVPLADVTAGFAGVSTSSYDAYVTDLPVATKKIADGFTDLEIIDQIPTGDEFGIVVSKDNPALLAAINGALAEIKEDGTLDAIWNKWMVETETAE